MVNQCNDSINGGGGTLRCSVKVTNNFVGRGAGASTATKNQCVGSGDGIANECDPFPASDDQRDDHTVQWLSQRRDPGPAEVHRDRHPSPQPLG